MECGKLAAGVAKLGQRRWDEVPVLNGSQVQILPSAPLKAITKASHGDQSLQRPSVKAHQAVL